MALNFAVHLPPPSLLYLVHVQLTQILNDDFYIGIMFFYFLHDLHWISIFPSILVYSFPT
jgi:hypothetical protein